MTVQDRAESPEQRFAPFYEAAARDRLVVQRCRSCDELQYYPRRRCIGCSGDDLEFEEVSGRGKLYSFTTVLRYPPSAFGDDLPYTLAIVKLSEGPQLLTRMVDCDPGTLACDMDVTCVFRDLPGGQRLPCFTPADGGGETS
jgi:uncharacterized OB-fold protein